MALFKKSAPTPEPTPDPVAAPRSSQEKKNTPTPSRREAEAARRERLNPTLSPKEARRRDREATYAQRQRDLARTEESPGRTLMRDLVDSRFNPAEIAMPVLLAVMALGFIPALTPYIQWLLYATWAYLALLVLDTYLMWRRFKELAGQRIPGTPLKGLLFYGFNRQMSFRRWRQPPPRIKRGESF